MMKNPMIPVLFLMVAFLTLFGGMAVTFVGAQSTALALSLSMITVMLAILICLDIGKLRCEF